MEASIAIFLQVADRNYIRSFATIDGPAELAVDKTAIGLNSAVKRYGVLEPHQTPSKQNCQQHQISSLFVSEQRRVDRRGGDGFLTSRMGVVVGMTIGCRSPHNSIIIVRTSKMEVE